MKLQIKYVFLGILIAFSFNAAAGLWPIQGHIVSGVGDILYANDVNNLQNLEAVATGQVLTSAGVETAPAWSAAPVLTSIDVNGAADAIILDTDADTTLSAPTDDQIDIEIGGADDFTFTANSFDVLTGSRVDIESGATLDIVGTFDISGTTVTTTAAELNAVADVSVNFEVVTGTNVITASETGKRFVLDTVTAFVSTLPAPALGLEFWFYIGANAPTTTHTIVTNASANIIEGSISSPEIVALVAVVAAADTISFVANLAVTGDFVYVWTDGTTWFISGMTFVQDGMTTTQAS